MTLEARDRAIHAFNTDATVTVFLMSLKAGGVALNLTAASHGTPLASPSPSRRRILCFCGFLLLLSRRLPAPVVYSGRA